MLKVCVTFIALMVLFTQKTYAVTVTINNPPSSISSDEFTLNITVSGANEGNNYLRVDLYKDGTSNYFGETYNGNEWYSGSDHTKYFQISIPPASDWTGDVKAKVGSPSTSEYDGQGSYKMRIRRYTNSGSQNSDEANASSVFVSINVPTYTPTPTNTPTPQPTHTPTPAPTNTPTPDPTSTPTPTKKISPTITPKKTSISPIPEVMAANTVGDQAPPSGGEVSGFDLGSDLDELESKEEGYNWWKLLIIMGTVIITGAVGVFLYNNHIKERSEELGNEV